VILHHAEWAARIPAELLDAESAESETLRAVAHAIDHGELPAGGFAMLVEFFRGTPHEDVIAGLSGSLVEDPDHALLETMLNDMIDGLRRRRIDTEINRRKADLTPEEWRDLVARKHGLKGPDLDPLV